MPDHCVGIAVLPADCPGISASTIRLLNRTFALGQAALLVPTYVGEQGHPRYVGRRMFDILRSLPDAGRFSDLFLQRPDEVALCDVAEASIVMDADTPDSYRELLRFHREAG